MAEIKTNAEGEFALNGTENEVSDIEPRVKVKWNFNGQLASEGWFPPLHSLFILFEIYHDCDDGWKPCQRKWKLRVPGLYITAEKDPPKLMDLGVLNLEVRLKSEERDCVH